MSYATKEQLEELASFMASQINVPTIGVGGGFAPIGTIISYMGTVAPQDYLACDGSTENIADYPQLADFFEAQFGSKNYFGGDGVTTFAVPDLQANTSVLYCIKAVVAGDVYSTDERVVGTWIDGKPLYQKTFYIEASITTYATGLTNIDNIFIKKQQINVSNNYIYESYYYDSKEFAYACVKNDGSEIVIVKSSQVVLTGSYITLQYTKTTD